MLKVKKVGLFDLNVYIEGNKEITNKILDGIKNEHTSVKSLSIETGIPPYTINSFLKGSSTKTKKLEKILNNLKIDKNEFEKLDVTIHSSPYKQKRYNFNFPISVDPLHIRLISHLLGDGSLEAEACRWYQEKDVGGKNITELIFRTTGIKIKKGAKNSYNIPIIMVDIIGVALNLKRSDIKTYRLVKKVKNLEKEYKLQLIASLIVDEGHITNSIIKIFNTDLMLLSEARDITKSLGYSCSIKSYNSNVGKNILINGKPAKMNYTLYALSIYADGLYNFRKDLLEMQKKYGEIAGLWHKQEDLIKFSNKVDLFRLEKIRKSKNSLVPIIKKEIKENPIKVKEFAKKYNLDYIRAYKLFYRIKEKEEIKKISNGIFASVNYTGPRNLTLRSKIEELLSETPISVKEIARITRGKPESISTQLGKLCKKGILKREKRGTYKLVN